MKLKANKYSVKIYAIIEVLLLVFSLLCFSLLIFNCYEKQIGLMELIESSLTQNIVYLLSMFNALCFFELLYIKKAITKVDNYSWIILNLLLLSITQLLMCNFVIALLLFYFVRKSLKDNQLTIKKLWHQYSLKPRHGIIIGNILFYAFSLIVIYIMVIFQFR